MAIPSPAPSRTIGMAMPGKYAVPAERRLTHTMPASSVTSPAMSRRVAPNRPATLAATWAVPNSTAVSGRNATPA